MRLYRLMIVPALLFLPSNARAAGVPNDCEQLIVAVAPDWDSMRGELQRFERSASGPWHQVGAVGSGLVRQEWARLGSGPRRSG